VRDELMEALPNEVIASAIKKLDTDDALYLIEDLERDDQREILSKHAEGGPRGAGARLTTPNTPPAA
jgi:Mg/Co/Ni transporter MgtE